MIYIFRKEMKKWHTVLWIVLFAFIITSGGTFFWRRAQQDQMKVASVNNQNISIKEYNKSLNQIKMQIEMYKASARAYGLPVDLFLNLTGLSNPEQAALEKCIREKLIDQAREDFKIYVDPVYVGKLIRKSLPAALISPDGSIDMQTYKMYLSRIPSSITEYESEFEENLKRSLYQDIVSDSAYIPDCELKEAFLNKNGKKSFKILVVPFGYFFTKIKSTEPSISVLEQFYNKNKNNYAVPEKRKIQYWTISGQDYAKNLDVDDQTIQNFYEKNKSSLFRIQPKIKVKRIVLTLGKDPSAQEAEKVLDKAKNIYNQLKKNPALFEDLIKKESQDDFKKFPNGIVGFFEKGTYDPEFEKSAFRLKEIGEISDIVKTEDNIQIIKLVERIPASEKPLEKVKDEIIKTIKSKKALINLTSEIRQAIYKLKETGNESALNDFISKNNLKAEETDWLTEQDANGDKLQNILAQKAFINKREGNLGFFSFGDNQVIYKIIDKQNAFVPQLAQIEKQVLQDYYENTAKHQMKEFVNKTVKELRLAKKLEDIEKETNFKLIYTGNIKNGDKISELSSNDKIISAAFVLDNPSQVFVYKEKTKKDGNNYCIIQLVNADKIDEKEFMAEKGRLLKEEKSREKSLQLNSFIESLSRNAKIEKTQKILNVN